MEDSVPYIGNFSRQVILAKMKLRRCVKFSPSHIFAILRTLNEDVLQGLFFAVSIFDDFREVENSAKMKPTQKIPDVLTYQTKVTISLTSGDKCFHTKCTFIQILY